MIRVVCSLILAVAVLTACKKEKHFLTDETYRKTVLQDFEGKKLLLSDAPENLFAVFDEPMTLEEREALQFLYAYAPLADLAWYGGEFLLKNVRMSFQLREEMPWGRHIPEDIFRHFVLPVRGHNEGLDSSRFVFYRELKDRVTACPTMEEAALEVNHWCHEKAIYQPTNARTCAPLTMTTTAYGRCGEESVFTLAAMRSVGIPARQVYTPRWAHCDDNHAWVEVWVDGQWKYLGACEPEPRLDIAWFTAPVRRGLYMEARVFGKYPANEEVVATNANLTSVNVTGNYTGVKKVVVSVQDTDRMPVAGAVVQYKIYNYGEYYPAVTLTADEAGKSSLTVGLGDWIVWAYKDGNYGFAELRAATADTVVIVLDKKESEAYRDVFDIVPPPEKEYQALTTDTERALNDRRFMYEDSLRNAYIATFMNKEEARQLAEEWGYDPDSFFRYIKTARGNYKEIVRFLESVKDQSTVQKRTALDLLGVLQDKDLQDITAVILSDHLHEARKYAETPVYAEYNLSGMAYPVFYKNYILNPRIRNEFITAYREPLAAYLQNENIRTPEDLTDWMQKIRLNDSINTINFVTPPVGVLRAMVTDTRSKEVFFVAACRTLGIAARLNPLNGKPEYNAGEGWRPVVFAREQGVMPKGKLMIHNVGKSISDPVYYTHFTISKIENGQAHLIDLGSNSQVDMGGGMNYSAIFKEPVELENGDYILVTGNRKSDGSVLSGITSFRVESGKLTEVDMEIRKVVESLKTLGIIDTKVKYMPEEGPEMKYLPLPVKGYTALALIGANQEPTNHLLRDMSGMKADFEAKGIPMLFLFTDRTQAGKFSRHDFRPLPSNLLLGYDNDGTILQMLETRLKLKNAGNLPLIVMVNAKCEVVFLSQGYRVGLGNQLIKYME